MYRCVLSLVKLSNLCAKNFTTATVLLSSIHIYLNALNETLQSGITKKDLMYDAEIDM